MSALPLPVPTPSPDQVRRYLARWREGDNEKIDAALRTAFVTMPKNIDVGQVGVKIAALNGLYSTNIFAVVQVARHIVSLNIDAALAEDAADPALIEKIANVEIRGKRRRNYSFATKYCNFHRPDVYPIYDSLVVGILNALLKQGEAFDTLTRGEHWGTDYAIWHRSIRRFREHYGLGEFSIRDIDKYLWTFAKERQVQRAGSTSIFEGAPTAT
ncbi:hypothetical protein [Micromonospora sp. NPDC048898]|uniref:hypothetical protein n=1 Tax=Micromonospora sp. NPDC048898 TaxID=3364260 RepID=UPI003722019B